MRFAALFLLLLLIPGPARAQESAASEDVARASGTAAFLVKASSLADVDRVFLGGWAGLTFGNRFSFGGGGVALTKDVMLGGQESASGFELGMGYGGALFQYRYPLRPRLQPHFSLLVGGGHAEVRDRLTGREIGADNFGIIEPEGGISFRVLSWLHLAGSAGYRWTWGVEDLPLVQSDDLAGVTATLSLRVGAR